MVAQPRLPALATLFFATVVVAMSSSHRRPASPGRAIARGFVPRQGVLPCQGATAGPAVLREMPMNPPAAIFWLQ